MKEYELFGIRIENSLSKATNKIVKEYIFLIKNLNNFHDYEIIYSEEYVFKIRKTFRFNSFSYLSKNNKILVSEKGFNLNSLNDDIKDFLIDNNLIKVVKEICFETSSAPLAIKYKAREYEVNMGLFKITDNPRVLDKVPTYIFKGDSNLTKSHIALNLSNYKSLSIFETDSCNELPKSINAELIVIGNRNHFEIDDVVSRISYKDLRKIIVLNFEEYEG